MKFIVISMSRNRLPKANGEIILDGLKFQVKIIRDHAGVPHIYARTEEDLFFAQGYCHAQDRFWQMELNRRISRGQLSEICGKMTLDSDIASRTLGFERIAKKNWELLDEHMKSVIRSYVAGVNAVITAKDWKMPIEFKLLRHKNLRVWDIEDTMAITRYLMWALSGCWRIEIPLMQLLEKIGEEATSEIFPYYPETNPTVMGEKIEMNVFEGKIFKAINGPFIRKGGASNSWTISPSVSINTDSAVLCNDTHLPLSVPAIWYMNHLKTIIDGKKKIDITGISCPGLPMVLVGHNQNFAYGSTLSRVDAEDLYIEKMNPNNPTQYEFKGEWRDGEVVEEVINIKDKAPHTEKIMITHHGPIISKSLNESSKVIAYNGMSLRAPSIIQSYYNLNTGSDWDDFVSAIRNLDAPQLNMSYADINGNTGWYVSGKLPIRAKSLGTTPVPGWTGEDEWTDEIPFDEMPHIYNPKNGIIVTCNNKIVPDSYPYFLGNLFMNGNRARRIIEYIHKKGKMEYPEDHMKLQNDVKSVLAIDLIAYIKNYHSENDDIELMLSVLKSWEGNLSIDSTPGLYYEVLKQNLKKTIFLPILGEKLMNSIFGRTFEENPILGNFTDIMGLDGPLILKLLNNPNSWWI